MTAIPVAEETRPNDASEESPLQPPSARWFRVGLAAIAVLALAIRVGYVLGWHHPERIGGDAFYYHFGANLLADGKGFLNPFRLIYDHIHTPGANHPPLYLMALSIGSVVGLDSYFDHQLLSCLMGTATVVVIALVARRIAGPRAGLVAAFVAAVYPNLWFNDAMVLSETLVQLMSALVLLTAYVFWERRSVRSAVVLGLMVGLAALTRAEMIMLSVLLIVPLCLLLRRTTWWRKVALLALAAVGVSVLVLPWSAYNTSRFAERTYISTGLGQTKAAANCDETYYGPFPGWKSYPCFLAIPTPPGDESQESVAYDKVANDYIAAHRGAQKRVMLQRIGRTWALYQPVKEIQLDRIDKRQLPASKVALGMYYLLAVASVGGAVLVRRRGWPVLPLVSLLLAVTVAVALTFGQTRYRASAEVSLVVLGSVLFAAVPTWLGRVRRGGLRRRSAPAR